LLQLTDVDYLNTTKFTLDEDCIFLNIWAPAKVLKGKSYKIINILYIGDNLAVLMYITGGVFSYESGIYP